jgi:hypothetical protein
MLKYVLHSVWNTKVGQRKIGRRSCGVTNLPFHNSNKAVVAEFGVNLMKNGTFLVFLPQLNTALAECFGGAFQDKA